ncbi:MULTISPECIES: ATP-grasp domain-containing protein [Streptomyces]|uniref:30S ribosomal protein S6 modification protein n=2 Tax=Streptomyces TaxID=1883 RepID=A0A2N8PIT2_STRNR|nr:MULTISPECIES: RimK family alpha-L-glutamate ligase [Streptomyces]PNE40917.1 30S ribosomal protein S6 modification protein [Streptomyces noursei]SHM50472.1 beta-citrylglutamate/N-acetylaspartylglutamate synthase [Streptomyces yunnanensis]
MPSAIDAPAEVWVLAREHPAPLMRATRALSQALEEAYGPRFAVWHSDELLFGVRDGRLLLQNLGGQDVPPPKVVLVRQTPGSMAQHRELTLLRHLEHLGAVLINSAAAHQLCGNKIWQFQELVSAGLPVPDSLSYATAPFAGVVRSPQVETPCVVKSVNGRNGAHVFLAPDAEMLQSLSGSLAQDVPLILQEYVAPSHGRDLRVIVVDGEPVAAQIRSSRDGSLASNLARGASAELCPGRYPEGEALAVRAARALGLTVAGVDLLFTADGGHTLCEVNAVPGWRPRMTTVIPAILAAVEKLLAGAGAPSGDAATGPATAAGGGAGGLSDARGSVPGLV